MASTLLTIVNDALLGLGLDPVLNVVNSSDANAVDFLAQANEAARMIRDYTAWPQLAKTFTITLAASTSQYAMPGDFRAWIARTFWSSNQFGELIGSISPQEWEYRKHGLISSSPWKRFRVFGPQSNTINLDPVPGSSDTGTSLTFEYISGNVCVPVTWTTATAFLANAYCSYNGNIYKTTLGGTTGTSAPTQVTSTPTSDMGTSPAGVTWTYYNAVYDRFMSDTDTCALDDLLMTMAIKWRWRRSKGLDYQDLQSEYQDQLGIAITQKTSAKILTWGGGGRSPLIGPWNIPDTGIGT